MAENTSYQYEFYQVSSDNQITGTELNMYPVGSIVFNKKRREITVVSDKIANMDGSHNNAIYGGGLASADVSEDGKILQITDFQGHTLNFSLNNYVTVSALGTELAKYYQKSEVDTLLRNKADISTTLAGYGITNAYTKDEIDETINEVNVRIDEAENIIAGIPTYTIKKENTAEEGYSSTYQLYSIVETSETPVGAKINIPKDMVVSSGAVVENPTGQAAGVYIELTLANATNDKLYIPVNQLVDDYTGSTYITVGTDGKIELNTTELSKVYASVDMVTTIGGTVTQHTTQIQGLSDNKASKTELSDLEDRVAAVEELAGIGGGGETGSLTERIQALEDLSYWKQLD